MHENSVAPHQQRPRRGRPSRSHQKMQEIRQNLIWTGVELLSQRGYVSTGLDDFLRQANIPKGSFYSLFSSKEAYGLEVLAAYASYFDRKLDRHLLADDKPPLTRLDNFMTDAKAGMARHAFLRGCVVGNLGQDVLSLPPSFRGALLIVLSGWEDRVAQCLIDAHRLGQIRADADPRELAHVFWIGWEGAVLRSRLERDSKPLDSFRQYFLAAITA